MWRFWTVDWELLVWLSMIVLGPLTVSYLFGREATLVVFAVLGIVASIGYVIFQKSES